MSDQNHLIQALDEKLAQTDHPLEMAKIYHEAASIFMEKEELDEACFFMTQAFILASHHGEKTLIKSSKEFLMAHHRI